jgi:hypothetical protein
MGVVLQHTPRAVIDAPPSLVIFPPLMADVSVIAVTDAVVIFGSPALVLKSYSVP